MNPIANSLRNTGSSILRWLNVRPALVTLVFFLVIGMLIAVWRAKGYVETARSRARTEARLRIRAIELQLAQVTAAVEALGVLATQTGGTMPSFQRVATGLLSTHPNVASLQLQPGGVIADIVPRAGHEQLLGSNVLADVRHSSDAYASIRERKMTVTGPVNVEGSQPGLVLRMPVFRRRQDGGEMFWGFVAASVRLPEILSRSGLQSLSERGYDFVCSVSPSAREDGVILATHGKPDIPEAVQHSLRAHRIELLLAIQPRGGWMSLPMILRDSLGVLAIAGLCSLLVAFLSEARDRDAILVEVKARLARETAERKRAQQDCRAAQEAVASARAGLDQGDPVNREPAPPQEGAPPGTAEMEAARQAKLEQAEAAIQELQAQVEALAQASNEAAQSAQKEQIKADETIGQLLARLQQAGWEAQTASQTAEQRLQQADQTIRDLESRVAELTERLANATGQSEEPTGPLEPEPAPWVPTEAEEDSIPAQEITAHAEDSESPEPVSRVSVAPPETPSPAAPEPESTPKARSGRSSKRKKADPEDQLSLFGQATVLADDAPVTQSVEEEAAGPVDESVEALSVPSSTDVPEAPAVEPSAELEPPEEIAIQEPPIAVVEEPAGADSPENVAPPVTELDAPESDGRETPPKPKEKKPRRTAASRPLPPTPPVDPEELRQAIKQILPLLADRDPGAKDCLKDNRVTFRSAFTPQGFVEFEQSVKQGDSSTALEHLKKAAKKHDIAL